jgi:hypothetical protein
MRASIGRRNTRVKVLVAFALGAVCVGWMTMAATPQEIERDETKLRDQLVGTWKIVAASFDGKPSELHQSSITLKLITPTHMIWIGYQPEDRRIFRSAGGSWVIQDGRYVETMRYGLDEKFRESTFGKSFAFDCRFDGNRWIQSGTMPGGVFLEEIWERVGSGDDVAAWPESPRK